MIAAVKPTDYQTQVKIFESAGCLYFRTHGDRIIYSFGRGRDSLSTKVPAKDGF
jgi:hypothetical protein